MIADPARLASGDPGPTGYMLHRAREAGTPPAHDPAAWTPLDGISPYLVFAVVKTEDPHFFRHRGIYWPTLRRAVSDALRRRGVRGASTITQQLARNLYLSPERSLRRKLREAWIALRMERALSKARILELYLNVAEWGEGVWGVRAASRHHFGRAPDELDAVEAAVLASLLPAPRRPLQGRNATRAWWVQRYVLFQLRNLGLLSLAEWRAGVARATSLCRLTHSGVPLAEAVERLRAALPAPVPAARGGLTVRELIADGCGVDRHVRFDEALRQWEASRLAGRPPTPAP
ncbi:MAG TPA: biosynthetic peptidoglycan transglycosylase [Longimicrobiaceae bacterium]